MVKPLPKAAGYVGFLITILPILWAGYESGGWKGALMALIGLLGGGTTLLAHSATGTGGKSS